MASFCRNKRLFLFEGGKLRAEPRETLLVHTKLYMDLAARSGIREITEEPKPAKRANPIAVRGPGALGRSECPLPSKWAAHRAGVLRTATRGRPDFVITLLLL